MLIGNIGIGLFVLITVWILALIIFVFGIKFQNNIAWISLSIAATFTIILVVLPVSKPNQSSETVTDPLDKDHNYMYQVVLLALLIISVVLGCIFFFILHCVEPVRPKAVKLLYINLSLASSLKKLITINSNDEFLSKVMNSENPVIVNFHAEWCEPCHILTPKMKELVEHHDNIDLAIVDVEQHAELVHTFEVKAVPAVIAVRNGLVVDKFIGLVNSEMIENLINKLDKKQT